MSAWLADNDRGEHAYVVTHKGPWRDASEWIVYAPSLKEAKDQHGYTRELHFTRRVRRARLSDRGLRVEESRA